MRTAILIIASCSLLLVAGACSDDDDNGNNNTQADGGGTKCGPGVYPCGPYGTNTNDKVGNMELEGYMDAKELCKPHKDKVKDTATLRKLSFKDYFLGDSTCASEKKKLLWVMVSAGWCAPCKAEVQAVQKDYKAGKYNKGLGIINVVFETTKKNDPADAKFIKSWADGFKLTFPVLMDPVFKTGAYFSSSAAPFNMLINTKEMTVVYRSTGADLTTLNKRVTEFFK